MIEKATSFHLISDSIFQKFHHSILWDPAIKHNVSAKPDYSSRSTYIQSVLGTGT